MIAGLAPILPLAELKAQAIFALAGVAPGLVLSPTYLTSVDGALAGGHLLAAWRRGPRGYEATLPFELVVVSLDAGALLDRRPIQAGEVGIYPGRELPNQLDEYLPESDPLSRAQSHRRTALDAPKAWELFRARQALDGEERRFVAEFQRARRDALRVQDHVFQEALHAEYDAWLKAA